MATSAATIAHIIDTMPDLNLTSKKMFGEAALYLNGVVVAFICDDTLFIKPTPSALAVLPGAERGPAYPGSKDYIIGSEALDDPDLCARALRAVAADAPPPNPKSPRNPSPDPLTIWRKYPTGEAPLVAKPRAPGGVKPPLPPARHPAHKDRIMDWITTLDALHAHYGTPSTPAVVKVTPHLTPSYRAFLDRARFCVLTTVGPEGTDGSPRGDQGPVVSVIDPQTLALPDWKGNERIDSLRNIVRDGRVSLMFLVPGSTTAIRVNGTARLTADASLCQSFTRDGKHPRTVIVIAIAEVYSQCARAIQRSDLWTSPDLSHDIPSVGTMLQEASQGTIDGSAYDRERATRAHLNWW